MCVCVCVVSLQIKMLSATKKFESIAQEYSVQDLKSYNNNNNFYNKKLIFIFVFVKNNIRTNMCRWAVVALKIFMNAINLLFEWIRDVFNSIVT